MIVTSTCKPLFFLLFLKATNIIVIIIEVKPSREVVSAKLIFLIFPLKLLRPYISIAFLLSKPPSGPQTCCLLGQAGGFLEFPLKLQNLMFLRHPCLSTKLSGQISLQSLKEKL